MKDPRLEKFGRFVMDHLRDRALHHAELMLSGHWKAPSLMRIQAELSALSPVHRQMVFRVVRSCVDASIHDFLFAVDERGGTGDVSICVDGVDVTTLSDGIHAEHVGIDGWDALYSKYGEAPEEA